MNNLAFYLARIYYNLTQQGINPIPYGFTDSYYAEKIYRHIAGLPSGISGGKNVSFWLENWYYYRTGQSYRLAIGDRPAWFWLSKLYAAYTGGNTQGILQPASAEFWAEKLLNILPAEISVTVNSIAQADNSTFIPSNPILGTVVQYIVRATNNGTANLTLQNGIRTVDWDAVTAISAWSSNVLIPGASATCTITLDTATSGAQTGYFEFVNNDPDDNESVYRVNVSYTVLNVTALWALNFTVNAAAPLPSPYTEDSSTATLVQVDGQFSKSSGALQFPAQATPVWGDQGLYRASTFTRAAGLAYVGKINLSNRNDFMFGYGNATGITLAKIVDHAITMNTSGNLELYGGSYTGAITAALSAATDYYLAVVALAAGAAFYIKGGTFTDWTLLFHTNISIANIAPLFANFDAAGALDYIHVGQIAAAHALAAGIKFTLNQATPAVNTNYTGEDDGITTLYYTLPGTPAVNDRVHLFYNYTDANNHWYARVIWDGAQWNTELYRVEAGATTRDILVSNILATNALRIIRRNNTHRLYTRNTSNVWTKRGADISNSIHSGVTTTRLLTAGTWTLAQLTAAPSTDAAYAVLDEV